MRRRQGCSGGVRKRIRKRMKSCPVKNQNVEVDGTCTARSVSKNSDGYYGSDDDGSNALQNEAEKSQLMEEKNGMICASDDGGGGGGGGEEVLSTLNYAVYGEEYEQKKKINSRKGDEKVDSVKHGGKRTGAESDLESKGGGGETCMDGNVGCDGGPRLRDLGGMNQLIEELEVKVFLPLRHPQVPRKLGVKPITGILLHGPPGCGKTTLARAIANEAGVPFYNISAPELVSGISGASEENIRELFTEAYRTRPSIVFIDEIDAIASKRENSQRDMERRIVTQLMTCMDESHKPADSKNSDDRQGYVLVIGATNRPESLDPALRRRGRFVQEILLGVPDENARAEILRVLTCNVKVDGDFDILKIARATPGFVGADLGALIDEAGNLAMKRLRDLRNVEISRDHAEQWWWHPCSPKEMEKLRITMADLEEAVKMVQPSLMREGFSPLPDVKWEDVGGLDRLREDLERHIVRRIKFPETYKGYGSKLGTGILLHGPPGCGKTLIAKAVANEAGANFIHIKGPEFLSKYVGESESEVRTIFRRARTCSPCIVFFDEVDSLTTNRGNEGGWVVERLVNQLLVELDGADQRGGVYVIGATNRPEAMDRALLRPGRFSKLLHVPLPNADERGLILKALARNTPIAASVDLMAIGRDIACENFSGADLFLLMEEAIDIAINEEIRSEQTVSDGTPGTIKETHFKQALGKMSPSVLVEEKGCCQSLSKRFKAA